MQIYKSNFRLNARHNMNPQQNPQGAHPHTFEIALFIEPHTDAFVAFEQMEKQVEGYLNRFFGKCVNELPPFDTIVPTVENMGRVFYAQLQEIMQKEGFHLLRLEIGETPSAVFSIASRLFVSPALYPDDNPVSRLLACP